MVSWLGGDGMGFRRRSGGGLVALMALAGMLLSGCGGGSATAAGPARVVALALGFNSALPNTTDKVTLAQGQTLAVQYEHTDSPGYWSQTSAGNGAVLGKTGTTTAGHCANGAVGCSSTMRQIYVARAKGSSTIVWTFQGVGPGFIAPSAQPTVPCPPAEAPPTAQGAPRCPVGIIRIVVTIT
jgi:hypothetical protein